MSSPRVCVVVLNWNGLKDTTECLQSLQRVNYPAYDVVLVDNASTGNDVAVLREAFRNQIHIIQNDKNYGYTGGNNIGMRYCLTHCRPDYLLILNNDTVVAPDFLAHLVQVAQNDEMVGMIGPKVYYHGSPNLIQTAGGTIRTLTGNPSLIGNKKPDTGQYDENREVFFLSGSCLLIRAEVTDKVGLFDDSYFLYWDDAEYCARVRKAGYRLMYAGQARVWHKAAFKKRPWGQTPAKARANQWTHYYGARNYFKFIRKYSTKVQYATSLIWFFGYHFWFEMGVCLAWYRDMRRFAAFSRGVKDGLFAPRNAPTKGGAPS